MCQIGETLLPMRVVEVGNVGDEQLRLVETQGSTAGQYTALSYCWGYDQPLKTTSANIEDMKTGIQLSHLPLTLVDAVRVTRSLGIQYLWIDALCIIQDSVEDWETQSEQMSTIYEKAYLVLAASSSASATQGFLDGQRPKRPYYLAIPDMYGTQATVAVGPKPRSGFHSLLGNHDPLSKRAWAFQEQHMSTRCLNFSTDELQWVCKTEAACECGFAAEQWSHHPLLQTYCGSTHQGGDAGCLESKRLQAEDVWRSVVRDYSDRRLTCADDRLPAISGIASRYGAAMGYRYVAGLWEENIIGDLAWSRESTRAPLPTGDKCKAPSFSWASIHCSVWFPSQQNSQTRRWTSCSSLCDAGTIVRGCNPFGRISDAWVTLRGPIARGFIQSGHRWDEFRSDDLGINVRLKMDSAVAEFSYTTDANEQGRSVRRCDFLQPPEEEKRERSEEDDGPRQGSDLDRASVWLLHLGRLTKGEADSQESQASSDCYLLLGRSPRDPQKYERIGLGYHYAASGQPLAEHHRVFTTKVMTIL